jgi:hypothetical protein
VTGQGEEMILIIVPLHVSDLKISSENGGFNSHERFYGRWVYVARPHTGQRQAEQLCANLLLSATLTV